MKYIKISCLAIVILGAALLAASCSKAILGNSNNPVAVSLPSADFGITILDYERGYDRDSNYVFEGVWEKDAFLFGVYKTEKMVPNITPDNGITFRINSDSPNFQGVNASSSKACIDIVQDGNDHTVYHLEWVEEGETTITFWNGEGESKKEISFTATSKKEIPLEGFKIQLGTIETKFERSVANDYEILGTEPFQHKSWNWRITQNLNKSINAYASEINNGWDGMEPIELIPIPLNATPKKYIANFYANGVVPDPNTKEGFRIVGNEELCSENAANFKDFSWINPNSYGKDIVPPGPTGYTPEDWMKNHRDCLTVYPSDLRERKIIIPYTKKNIGFTNVSFSLYSGNMRDFSLKEVEMLIF